jgi:hypothetical protein
VRHEAWPVVLDRWVARLALGISAAATHGVIRTGHAVRALDQATTAQRLIELTEGLAYWASTYQPLSSNAVSHAATARPTEAIAQVPILPVERRRFTGTITSALAALDDFPDFADAINPADLEGNPHTVLSEITAALTGVYLANARDVLTTIVFIHGVTSAAAVRSLAPHLSVATMGTTIRYLWQAGCGLYAAFGSRPSPPDVIANSGESRAALIDLAVACGDEHAIKFTEACRREDQIAPRSEYRTAARHAISILTRP